VPTVNFAVLIAHHFNYNVPLGLCPSGHRLGNSLFPSPLGFKN
jgi:hypothetical protein